MLHVWEHFNTLSLTASLQEATESIVPHFTNKKTEAQGKTILLRLLSIGSPGGPRIHYVVQAGPDRLTFACRVLRLQTNVNKDQSLITSCRNQEPGPDGGSLCSIIKTHSELL